jgi:hypothetical protein
MKPLLQLPILVLSAVLIAPGAQVGEVPDSYSLAIVKRCIRERQMGLITGHQLRYLPRLGDKAAIAIIKIYDGPGLIDPKNVKAYLPLIQLAFQDLRSVTDEEDHQPAVTLLLLHYLRANIQDAALKGEISKVEEQVLQAAPKSPPY